MKRSTWLVVGLSLALAPAAFAQTAGGNIYGTVTDESGAVLPGATVRLSSDFGTREATSASQGEFRFINLERGDYKLTTSLTGFTTVTRAVTVNVGTNVDVGFALKVAGVEETVTVTAETPVVDTKKTGTGVTIMKEELEKIPSARDPWAMLRAVPGVIVDRVNIGGNENGQQANFTGPRGALQNRPPRGRPKPATTAGAEAVTGLPRGLLLRQVGLGLGAPAPGSALEDVSVV